ncbi:hypothetical protein GmRootV116_09270 [Variovorax sp. V116]
MPVQGLSFRRGGHAALAALEQRHAAVLLEIGDALAGRRKRDAESICARRQASTIDDRDKKPQGSEIETVQIDHGRWI